MRGAVTDVFSCSVRHGTTRVNVVCASSDAIADPLKDSEYTSVRTSSKSFFGFLLLRCGSNTFRAIFTGIDPPKLKLKITLETKIKNKA